MSVATGKNHFFQIIRMSIVDTNNHFTEFHPGDKYDYKILTPMPLGVPTSTFYGPIRVRDYDITTSRVNFGIKTNDYIEMVYDKVDDLNKIHTGILKTKNTFSRLDETLVLRISATVSTKSFKSL